LVLWDDLGFATNYAVEIDPEYPGDGEWSEPRFGDADLPIIGRISPDQEPTWLLSASTDDVVGLYGTPGPNVLCLFERFDQAVLINVRDPSSQFDTGVLAPLSVHAVVESGLLLVATEFDLTALGRDGIVWRSARLFTDDLRVRRTDNDRIVCRGWNYWESAPTEITLDALTGEQISGQSYEDWKATARDL
jgi:hypothetical protein